MKKAILAISLLLISGSLFAQRFNLGIKAGVNFGKFPTKTELNNFTDYTSKNKVGFNGGIFARVKLYKGLHLQPEVLVSYKRGAFDYADPNTGKPATQVLKLVSLDVPLFVGYQFGQKTFNFRVFAGPMASFTISQKVKVTTDGVIIPQDQEFDFKDAIWSVKGGVGVDIWKFTLDLTYEHSFNDITWKQGYKQGSSQFNLALGFKFFRAPKSSESK